MSRTKRPKIVKVTIRPLSPLYKYLWRRTRAIHGTHAYAQWRVQAWKRAIPAYVPIRIMQAYRHSYAWLPDRVRVKGGGGRLLGQLSVNCLCGKQRQWNINICKTSNRSLV